MGKPTNINIPQPQVLPSEQITDVKRTIPEGIFDREFSAQQGMGQAISQRANVYADMAGALGNLSMKMMDIQRNREEADSQVQYEEAFEGWQIAELQNPDYAGRVERFRKFHDTATKQILSATKSPSAKRNIERYLKKQGISHRINLAYDGYKEQIESTRKFLPSYLEMMSKLYADAPNETARTAIQEDVNRKIADFKFGDEEEGFWLIEKQQIFDKAARKQYTDGVWNTLMGIMRPDNPDKVDYGKIKELLADRTNPITSGLDDNEQEQFLKNVNILGTQQKLEDDNELEAERKVIDDIFIKPQDEFLASASSILQQINTSIILTTKDKEEQRKKINDRINAIKSGDIDPVDKFDPQAYNNLSVRISRNSKSVKSSEIENAVGKGDDGGITVKQKEVLFDLKKKYDGGDLIGNRLHSTYSGAISGLRISKAFGKNKVDNVKLAAEAQSVLDSWALKNPDASESDYEDFFNRLVDTSNLSGWYTFFTRKTKEQRVAIQENLQEMKKEIGGKKRYKKGDKRTINGKTYTFNGVDWD